MCLYSNVWCHSLDLYIYFLFIYLYIYILLYLQIYFLRVMYGERTWDFLWALTFQDGGVSVKRLWQELIGCNYTVRNQWRTTINTTNLAALWDDRLAQQNFITHNSRHENDRQHKTSITHLMHILCFLFIPLVLKSFLSLSKSRKEKDKYEIAQWVLFIPTKFTRMHITS